MPLRFRQHVPTPLTHATMAEPTNSVDYRIAKSECCISVFAFQTNATFHQIICSVCCQLRCGACDALS